MYVNTLTDARNISTRLTIEGQPPVCISRPLTPRYNIAYIVISDNVLSLIRSGIFAVSFRVPTIVELARKRLSSFSSSVRIYFHTYISVPITLWSICFLYQFQYKT